MEIKLEEPEPCIFYDERTKKCSVSDFGAVGEVIPNLVDLVSVLKEKVDGSGESKKKIIAEIESLIEEGLNNELSEDFTNIPDFCPGLSPDGNGFSCYKYGLKFKSDDYKKAVYFMRFFGHEQGCLCYIGLLVDENF